MNDMILKKESFENFINGLSRSFDRIITPKNIDGIILFTEGADNLTLDFIRAKKSPKEVVFPSTEVIFSFEKKGKDVILNPVDFSSFPSTVVFGLKPCDAALFPILDNLFSWDYKDSFYLERRKKTFLISIACTKSDDFCFCTSVGLAPDSTLGSDIILYPLKNGNFKVKPVTEKGDELLNNLNSNFDKANGNEELSEIAAIKQEIDVEKVKKWLDTHFDDPVWAEHTLSCIGCGTCAFICPTCHCFDIVDEGDSLKGVRRKNWDGCAFSKFTLHASGHNPRDIQPARYRQRIMHKFKYYKERFGTLLCTGCGRCSEACPSGIEITEILKAIENKG